MLAASVFLFISISLEAVPIYEWFLDALKTAFEEVCILKKSSRGTVRAIRHRATGKKFILRCYTGSAEVYRKLLSYTCPNLPTTLEVASNQQIYRCLALIVRRIRRKQS